MQSSSLDGCADPAEILYRDTVGVDQTSPRSLRVLVLSSRPVDVSRFSEIRDIARRKVMILV
jgi:hypothetical protein